MKKTIKYNDKGFRIELSMYVKEFTGLQYAIIETIKDLKKVKDDLIKYGLNTEIIDKKINLLERFTKL